MMTEGLWDGWPGAWGCPGQGVECGLGLVDVMCCISCWELISWGGVLVAGRCFWAGQYGMYIVVVVQAVQELWSLES